MCVNMGVTILHPLDWLVIAAYFIGIVWLGIWVGRRVRHTEDFFLGRRSFGPWLIIGQAFGVGTHAEMPVSLAGAVYQFGYSAIWYQWKNLFITPFYWLLGPIFRRFRRTTLGEVYEDRYGPWMGGVYTLWALAYFIFNMGAMLKGAGKLVSAACGGAISANAVVLLMTVSFALYSVIGGLVASAYTNFVQGFLIVVLSFLLVPLGLARVGGFTGIRESLPPNMLSLITPGEIGVFMITMLTINGLIGIVAQPHMLAAVGTGKDEWTCRVGMTYGNFVKRVCTIGWALTGLIAAVMLAQEGHVLADREDAFGYAVRQLFFPGSIGLMVASVLAANMSTCSAFAVDGGALFTQNFYRRFLVRDRDDRHYLRIGRLSGVLITVLGVLFGLYVEMVLEAFLFTETLATFMGISLFAALCWRRATRWGAFTSLLASSAVFFVLTQQKFQTWLRWDPVNFGWSLVAGFAALVVASYLTRPEPERRLEEFYNRLEQASYFDEVTGEEKPVEGPGQQLLVVHLLNPGLREGWRSFYRRFAVDLKGLVVAFGVVGALIALAKLILYLP